MVCAAIRIPGPPFEDARIYGMARVMHGEQFLKNALHGKRLFQFSQVTQIPRFKKKICFYLPSSSPSAES